MEIKEKFYPIVILDILGENPSKNKENVIVPTSVPKLLFKIMFAPNFKKYSKTATSRGWINIQF